MLKTNRRKRSLMILWVLLCTQAILLAQKNYVIQSADNISLHVNEYGQGKPVVLLAGGPGFNAAYLEPIWKALPGYNFIVPDQRGTGHSAMHKIDSSQIMVSRYVMTWNCFASIFTWIRWFLQDIHGRHACTGLRGKIPDKC